MDQKRLRLETNVQRGPSVQLEVDGEPVQAYEGETVAAALLAAGRPIFRHTPKGQPRGIFCGIGICFDCLVTVDGQPNVRACITPVRQGMIVRTTPAGAENRG